MKMSPTEKLEDEENGEEEIYHTDQQLKINDQAEEKSEGPTQDNQKFQPIKNLKFSGMKDPVHPRLFIENFERFADQEKLNEDEKQNHFIGSLSKYAAIWMEQRGYGTYEEMKEAFLTFYWSLDVQSTFEKYLDSGKYNKKCKLSMANYFFKHAIGAKFLNSAPSEKEIISKLLKHFDSNVGDEIVIQKAETIGEAVGILRRIDVLRGNVPNNRTRKNFILTVLTPDDNNKKGGLNLWGWLFLFLACTSLALSVMSRIYPTN